MKLTDLHPASSQLLQFDGSVPIPLQVGDLNLDGYPDVLAIVKSEKGSSVVLLENIPCEKEVCTAEAVAAGRRTLRLHKDSAELSKVPNVRRATFLDLDEKVGAMRS